MPYVLKDGQHIAIALDAQHEIGEGGMGVVYRIGNLFGTGNMVAKIFKNPNDPKNPSLEKLQAMIERPPEHVYEVINGVGYTQFAWVQHLIVDDSGQVTGYVMPELDFDTSFSLNPFMYPREATKLTAYQQSLNYRVQLCANISALMADLHRHGHAFIDFKEQNLRLMPEPKTGRDDDYKGFIVGFIDCDSYRISRSDGKIYPSPVISPEMTSPEYHEHKNISQLDERHDRFVLAIELFKILNNGIHPFYFIPLSERLKNLPNRNTDQFIKERLYAYGLQPNSEIAPLKNSIHQCWDDATRAMFDKAFLSVNPNDRPTAEQWEDHLRNLSRERQFVVCANYPNDASHIHFVDKPCHRCWLMNPQANANVSTPNFSQSAQQNTTHVDTTNRQSVWNQPNSSATNNSQNISSQTPVSASSAIGDSEIGNNASATHLESLVQNRQWEQNLNTNRTPHVFTAPQSVDTQSVEISNTEPTSYPESSQPVDNAPPVAATPSLPQKKSGKWWVVPVIIGVVGFGGYGISKMSSTGSNSQHSAASQDDSSNSSNNDSSNNTATASAKSKANEQKVANANTYAAVIKNLPEAKSTIATELDSVSQQGGLFGKLTQASGAKLYDKTLGISPDFFDEVIQVANKGESELEELSSTAYGKDIESTQAYARQAFRATDMSYFGNQPKNTTLAKQFNAAAKNYYWNKKDPKGAVYLQAQAVKNSPNQGEYVANLAYYLFKNNYPYAKEFMLYALQTPRDAKKYPNTYMIELSAAMDLKEGNEKAATGALLAQFYTSDDQEKRCQNMLRYPQTYPELVPVAEKVLTIIDEQNSNGVNPAPEACLPPFQWVQ